MIFKRILFIDILSVLYEITQIMQGFGPFPIFGIKIMQGFGPFPIFGIKIMQGFGPFPIFGIKPLPKPMKSCSIHLTWCQGLFPKRLTSI